MRVLCALVLSVLSIPQTDTDSRGRSGVEIASVKAEFKMVDRGAFQPRMVLNRPPVLNPSPDGSRANKITSPVFANEREKARISPGPILFPAYLFQIEMKNGSAKSVTRVVWAYHPLNWEEFSKKEFVCNLKMGPGETKALEAISSVPRQRVVSADQAGTLPPDQKPSLQDMVVNKVWFSDGTTWQRTDWNPIILSRLGGRKVGKGKCMAF